MSEPRFAIDDSDLCTEFAELAGHVAYYGSMLAQARTDRELAKLALEETRAKAHLLVRESTANAKPKPTVADIDATVAMRADVHDARMAYIESEAAHELAKSNLAAMLAKRDMLISLGAHVRSEMDTTVTKINNDFVR